VDLATINHQPSIDALKACGLFKFWAIPGMRAQVDFSVAGGQVECTGPMFHYWWPPAQNGARGNLLFDWFS